MQDRQNIKDSLQTTMNVLTNTVNERNTGHTTVVCSLLDAGGRFLHYGVNSIPWDKNFYPERYTNPECYDWVLHAELNALQSTFRLSFNDSVYPKEIYGAIVLSTRPIIPCMHCMKTLVSVLPNFKNIYCSDAFDLQNVQKHDPDNRYGFNVTVELMKLYQIKYHKIGLDSSGTLKVVE